MSSIHYTIQDRHQLRPDLDWLTQGEQTRLDGFRFEKRRRDWLLGRWAAKIALLGLTGLSQRDINRFEISSESDGAPLPMLDGRRCRVQLSLSHSNDRAFATVSRGTKALGCDIELVEPRSSEFVDTYFTVSERNRIEHAEPGSRDSLVTLFWSAKESTLKALHTGLQVDTRSVEVHDDGDSAGGGWRVARTISTEGGEFKCLWRIDDKFVLSIVTRDSVETPISTN